MTSDLGVILLKVGVAVLGGVCFLFLRRAFCSLTLAPANLFRWSVALWFVSRIGLFGALYMVLNTPAQSDVPGYYYPQARAVLQGGVPYVDFSSSYGPLFPYIAALPTLLWPSPKSIILLSVLIEGLSIVIWWRVGRMAYEESALRLSLLLYLCNPVAIINVAVAGQNQVWLSALWGLSLHLAFRKRDFLSGACLGVSAIGVKILGLVVVPYLWVTARSRLTFAGGVVSVVGLVAVPFWFLGADLLQPIRLEGGQISSGNLPYLATVLGLSLTDRNTGLSLNILLGVSVSIISLLRSMPGVRKDTKHAFRDVTIIMLTFMILSKKSYTNYLAIFLFPLCCCVSPLLRRNRWAVLFFGFAALAAVEPSLWFRWFPGMTFEQVMSQELFTGRAVFTGIAFSAVEVCLVGGYAVLMILCARSGRVARPAGSDGVAGSRRLNGCPS